MKKAGKIKTNEQNTSGDKTVKARKRLVVLLMICLLSPVSAWSQQKRGLALSGYLSTYYRYRATETDQDQDLYQYVSLQGGDENLDKISGHLFGRITYDIDGVHDEDEHFVFDSITDTYDTPLNARLYSAYVDFNRPGPLKKIRLGRQTYYRTPIPMFFDGVYLESMPLREALSLQVAVYGGLPVRLYEDTEEGTLAGAAFRLRPWQGARFSLDYIHVEDDTTLGTQRNDFYAARLWQNLGDYLSVNALHTWIEDKARDLKVQAAYFNPEQDLSIDLAYYELLETQKDYTLEFDPFFAIAKTLKPYRNYQAVVAKGLGEHLAVEVGLDLRRLRNADDESEFNHEFSRYYLTLRLREWPIDGMEVSASGENWKSDTEDEEINTYAADISYRPEGSKFSGSAGTHFALYKYDYYQDDELTEVRTYYARLKYKATDSLSAELGYEQEQDEFDTYHTIRAVLRYFF